MEWKTTGVVVSAALMLGACAGRSPAPVTSDLSEFNPRISCSADVDPEHRVELEMVDTLMARERNYAALAQLQGWMQSNQGYWHRYGQLLAKTGDLERADRVFTSLKNECESGEAYHGLGMVALKNGDLGLALSHFETALNMLPASSSVRNDYGYALMLSGEYDAAQRHLRTALELENGNGKARQNLAIAYLLSNNEEGLGFLKTEYHFTDDELAYAENLAAQLRR